MAGDGSPQPNLGNSDTPQSDASSPVTPEAKRHDRTASPTGSAFENVKSAAKSVVETLSPWRLLWIKKFRFTQTKQSTGSGSDSDGKIVTQTLASPSAPGKAVISTTQKKLSFNNHQNGNQIEVRTAIDDKKKYEVHSVMGDGACLFRSVNIGYTYHQNHGDYDKNDEVQVLDLRKQVVDALESNDENLNHLNLKTLVDMENVPVDVENDTRSNFKRYCDHMRKPDTYGDHIELVVLSYILGMPIKVYQRQGSSLLTIVDLVDATPDDANKDTFISVLYHGVGNDWVKSLHYEALTPARSTAQSPPAHALTSKSSDPIRLGQLPSVKRHVFAPPLQQKLERAREVSISFLKKVEQEHAAQDKTGKKKKLISYDVRNVKLGFQKIGEQEESMVQTSALLMVDLSRKILFDENEPADAFQPTQYSEVDRWYKELCAGKDSIKNYQDKKSTFEQYVKQFIKDTRASKPDNWRLAFDNFRLCDHPYLLSVGVGTGVFFRDNLAPKVGELERAILNEVIEMYLDWYLVCDRNVLPDLLSSRLTLDHEDGKPMLVMSGEPNFNINIFTARPKMSSDVKKMKLIKEANPKLEHVKGGKQIPVHLIRSLGCVRACTVWRSKRSKGDDPGRFIASYAPELDSDKGYTFTKGPAKNIFQRVIPTLALRALTGAPHSHEFGRVIKVDLHPHGPDRPLLEKLKPVAESARASLPIEPFFAATRLLPVCAHGVIDYTDVRPSGILCDSVVKVEIKEAAKDTTYMHGEVYQDSEPSERDRLLTFLFLHTLAHTNTERLQKTKKANGESAYREDAVLPAFQEMSENAQVIAMMQVAVTMRKVWSHICTDPEFVHLSDFFSAPIRLFYSEALLNWARTAMGKDNKKGDSNKWRYPIRRLYMMLVALGVLPINWYNGSNLGTDEEGENRVPTEDIAAMRIASTMVRTFRPQEIKSVKREGCQRMQVADAELEKLFVRIITPNDAGSGAFIPFFHHIFMSNTDNSSSDLFELNNECAMIYMRTSEVRGLNRPKALRAQFLTIMRSMRAVYHGLDVPKRFAMCIGYGSKLGELDKIQHLIILFTENNEAHNFIKDFITRSADDGDPDWAKAFPAHLFKDDDLNAIFESNHKEMSNSLLGVFQKRRDGSEENTRFGIGTSFIFTLGFSNLRHSLGELLKRELPKREREPSHLVESSGAGIIHMTLHYSAFDRLLPGAISTLLTESGDDIPRLVGVTSVETRALMSVTQCRKLKNGTFAVSLDSPGTRAIEFMARIAATTTSEWSSTIHSTESFAKAKEFRKCVQSHTKSLSALQALAGYPSISPPVGTSPVAKSGGVAVYLLRRSNKTESFKSQLIRVTETYAAANLNCQSHLYVYLDEVKGTEGVPLDNKHRVKLLRIDGEPLRNFDDDVLWNNVPGNATVVPDNAKYFTELIDGLMRTNQQNPDQQNRDQQKQMYIFCAATSRVCNPGLIHAIAAYVRDGKARFYAWDFLVASRQAENVLERDEEKIRFRHLFDQADGALRLQDHLVEGIVTAVALGDELWRIVAQFLFPFWD